MLYINYYFKNIEYSDDYYKAEFYAPDNDVRCRFSYNRKTKEIDVFDSNKPVNEIMPLPIGWLDFKLKEKGYLDINEAKISY